MASDINVVTQLAKAILKLISPTALFLFSNSSKKA